MKSMICSLNRGVGFFLVCDNLQESVEGLHTWCDWCWLLLGPCQLVEGTVEAGGVARGCVAGVRN